nr:hemerythrin domain-containing protein [Mucilaginibacter sp. L294]
MKNKPIKRSGYLVTLSRDHHSGLLFCWKIKEGVKRGVSFDRINYYIRYFWESHLFEHFREEEILLFNQISGRLTEKARDDHQELADWFKKIIDDGINCYSGYLTFIGLLTDHIRFEERQVFPFLEQELPAKVLTGIRDILIKLHQDLFIDNYADEFWADPKKANVIMQDK